MLLLPSLASWQTRGMENYTHHFEAIHNVYVVADFERNVKLKKKLFQPVLGPNLKRVPILANYAPLRCSIFLSQNNVKGVKVKDV